MQSQALLCFYLHPTLYVKTSPAFLLHSIGVQCFSIFVLISFLACWKLSTLCATESAVLPPDRPSFSWHWFHWAAETFLCDPQDFLRDSTLWWLLDSSLTRGLLEPLGTVSRKLSDTASGDGLPQWGCWSALLLVQCFAQLLAASGKTSPLPPKLYFFLLLQIKNTYLQALIIFQWLICWRSHKKKK